ncbi:hypothetical protein ACQY0O_005626 [Thecaphora frezii]
MWRPTPAVDPCHRTYHYHYAYLANPTPLPLASSPKPPPSSPSPLPLHWRRPSARSALASLVATATSPSVVAAALATLAAFVAASLAFHTVAALFLYLSLLGVGLPILISTRTLPSPSATRLLRLAAALFYLAVALSAVSRSARLWPAPPPPLPLSPSGFNVNRTVFIASNLHNSERVLPHYAAALEGLVQRLGADRTFVSIYESHSTDATRPLLRRLDARLGELGVRRRIKMDDAHTKVGIGPHRNGRIDYLAYVRNVAMEPLLQPHGALEFSHVLWINDVYFDPDQLVALLDTNGGRYDQACALDLIGSGFYDVWVMRDVEGNTAKRPWPYFAEERDVEALKARRPFLVNACWNGATAFDARWFRSQQDDRRFQAQRSSAGNATQPTTAETATAETATAETAMATATATASLTAPPTGADTDATAQDPEVVLPLRFRSSLRCFSSECQLVSYDIHRATAPRRPLIFVHPGVRVTYEWYAHVQHAVLVDWWLTAPWRVVWQDWIAYRVFGRASEAWRWPNTCKAFQDAWTAPEAEVVERPYRLA